MNIIQKCIWIIAVVGLSGCAYYNTLFNAKNSYNDGLKTIRENPDQKRLPQGAQRHFETTIEKCWKLIDIYSENSKYADDALLYIAKSEFYLGKYGLSRQHLEQFMQRYTDSKLLSEAHLWYGKVLLVEEDIDKANEYFRLVINTSNDGQIRSQASFELGKYAFEKKEYARAIELLETALKEKLEEEYKALVTYYLAEAYLTQNNYKSAIKQYEKVEKFKPTLDIEYKSKLHHARALSANKEYKKADEILRKMLTAPRFDAFKSSINSEIAKNYEVQGDYLSAEEIYREVVAERRRDNGTALAAYNLGKLYESELYNLDSAVAYYGMVSKLTTNFDSLAVADHKKKSLGEFKEIVDNIYRDESLVYRLTNEPDFRDSLYQAQYEDSLRLARGEGEELPLQAESPVLRPDSLKTDSLQVQIDSTGLPVPLSQDAKTDPEETNTDSSDKTAEEFLGFRNSNATDSDKDQPASQKSPVEGSQEDQEVIKKAVLEKRKLPEIEFDLMNKRFELAEYYLLKEAQYDSAAHYYQQFIDTYEDSLLTPKSYYSLIYIYSQEAFANPQRVYALDKELLGNYIESPFSIERMKSNGMYVPPPVEKQPEELAYQRFLQAESLYFAGSYRRAAVEYQKIAQLDSSWDISAKAQFAAAWVYEKDLGMRDSAMVAYEQVVKRFPTAREYVTVARKKITPPKIEVAVAPDSAVVTDAGKAAPADTVATPAITEGREAESTISTEDILEEKIRWRNRRELR